MNKIEKLLKLQAKLVEEKDNPDGIFCTIEEMSEVTKVLTKHLRKSRKFKKENLIEEVAHSLLMLTYIKDVFHITDEEIQDIQIDTIQRFLIENDKQKVEANSRFQEFKQRILDSKSNKENFYIWKEIMKLSDKELPQSYKSELENLIDDFIS